MKVTKICLDLGGKKLELTLEQAKKLKELLNETFGVETVIYRDSWNVPYWTPNHYDYLSSHTITAGVSSNIPVTSSYVNMTKDELSGNYTCNLALVA